MGTKAIAIIDMTNDFVYEEYFNPYISVATISEYGKLVAPLGKTIIEPIAKLMYAGGMNGHHIVYIEDEHTEESEEIKSGKYPEHNMKDTPGAETIMPLIVLDQQFRFSSKSKTKVMHVKKDYFNGFTNPELDKTLKKNKIDEVYVTGLVQEICVKETTEGFLEHGYKVNVVVDATVPFDEYAGLKALEELEEKGARLIDLETALKEVSS